MALKSEVRHGDGLVMIRTEELRKGDEKRCYGMARTRTALRGHRYDTYRRATEKQGLGLKSYGRAVRGMAMALNSPVWQRKAMAKRSVEQSRHGTEKNSAAPKGQKGWEMKVLTYFIGIVSGCAIGMYVAVKLLVESGRIELPPEEKK
jgi:hypothetical protein